MRNLHGSHGGTRHGEVSDSDLLDLAKQTKMPSRCITRSAFSFVWMFESEKNSRDFDHEGRFVADRSEDFLNRLAQDGSRLLQGHFFLGPQVHFDHAEDALAADDCWDRNRDIA